MSAEITRTTGVSGEHNYEIRHGRWRFLRYQRVCKRMSQGEKRSLKKELKEALAAGKKKDAALRKAEVYDLTVVHAYDCT